MSPRPDTARGQEWLKSQTRQVSERSDLAVSEQTASAVEVEAWLQRRGVKYAPATGIPMHMIDKRRSRQNQARRDPIVPESVEWFTSAFRAGRPFPPIVVYPVGQKLVIIDGNNRHESAERAKLQFIQGIIIDEKTDSDLIQLLTVEANSSHGVTPPLEWRVRQAFYLVDLGHPDDLAAEAAGITLTQLRNARAAREADARAKKLGVYGFSEISATAKQYLNGLKLEPVFHAAARLTAGSRLSLEQVIGLCRSVKKGNSEAEQLAIVEEHRGLLDLENNIKKAEKRGVSSPKQVLVSGIGMITKCDPVALVNSIRTVHDRDTIKARLQEAEDALLEIMVAVEQLKNMEE